MKTTASSTRERLIKSAGEVFAAVGFDRATIREICAKAEANVAAVNYHFGGKQGLYLAALEQAEIHSAGHPARAAMAALEPEDQLRLFVQEFVQRLLDQEKPAWQSKLIVRELAEPTEALELIVQRTVRPRWALLVEIVKGVLGPGFERATIEMSAASVIAQCVTYKNCAPILERVMQEDLTTAESITARANHIAEFSLAAMRSMRERAGGMAGSAAAHREETAGGARGGAP